MGTEPDHNIIINLVYKGGDRNPRLLFLWKLSIYMEKFGILWYNVQKNTKGDNEMKKEKPTTKLCKHCKTEIPYGAKVCPQCRKKQRPGGCLIAVLVVIGLGLLGTCFGGASENDGNDTKKIREVGQSEDKSDSTSAKSEDPIETEATAENVQTEYYVGDILQDGDMKIVYMSSGEYSEDNEFMQSKEGYKYIYLQFAFENTSTKSDNSISFYDFEAYADGYNVDMYYGGEEDLSATLSPGRVATGYIYFEIPMDSNDVEVEYETNFFTQDKIYFRYEGEKDSGYIIEPNKTPTEGAYSVGDIIEMKGLNMTYLSCDIYISENMFVEPKPGYSFITCEFEFENTGESDESISSYSFDCYADGMSCNQTFIREDDLSATISKGRKAKGTVTFEIPDDATVVELEYNTNIWTSDRVVFTIR